MQGLREHADDSAFQEKWREVKQIAKSKAVEKIAQITGEDIPPHALLDIQVGALPSFWMFLMPMKSRQRSAFQAATSVTSYLWSGLSVHARVLLSGIATLLQCLSSSHACLCQYAGEENTRVQATAAQCVGHHLAL